MQSLPPTWGHAFATARARDGPEQVSSEGLGLEGAAHPRFLSPAPFPARCAFFHGEIDKPAQGFLHRSGRKAVTVAINLEGVHVIDHREKVQLQSPRRSRRLGRRVWGSLSRALPLIPLGLGCSC